MLERSKSPIGAEFEVQTGFDDVDVGCHVEWSIHSGKTARCADYCVRRGTKVVVVVFDETGEPV